MREGRSPGLSWGRWVYAGHCEGREVLLRVAFSPRPTLGPSILVDRPRSAVFLPWLYDLERDIDLPGPRLPHLLTEMRRLSGTFQCQRSVVPGNMAPRMER